MQILKRNYSSSFHYWYLIKEIYRSKISVKKQFKKLVRMLSQLWYKAYIKAMLVFHLCALSHLYNIIKMETETFWIFS